MSSAGQQVLQQREKKGREEVTAAGSSCRGEGGGNCHIVYGEMMAGRANAKKITWKAGRSSSNDDDAASLFAGDGGCSTISVRRNCSDYVYALT